MYEPHEAREDTVLFPAFREVVSPHEHDALGEEFEGQEHALFGQDGFEMMVDKIARIEKTQSTILNNSHRALDLVPNWVGKAIRV